MGQQQLLYIILGAVLVGIAVAAAMAPSAETATDMNRDAIVKDLMDLSSKAQQFYHAASKNGGANSFENISMSKLTNMPSNDNGSYSILNAGDEEMVFVGKGVYLAGADTVEVHCTVTPNNYTITRIH